MKYVVKNQNAVDNIAALTLSSSTKKVEEDKEHKYERIKAQLLYGRIVSMAYARSNLNEVGAVTAVHYFASRYNACKFSRFLADTFLSSFAKS